MLLVPLLCALLAAKPARKAEEPPPLPADWVDLLDFDQGTLLTNAPPSLAEGVEAWAALYLTDGGPKGWSSADGRPRGVEFIFELERDAEVKLLRVSTEKADELTYPGASARGVELWVAGAKGDFEKLGTLELERPASVKELPLKERAPVRRLKLVVASNFGHPQFTQVMEVDLLGRPTGPAPVVELTQAYYSKQWQGLRIRQTGTRVEGCYDFNAGTFFGELEGRVARVVWNELVIDGRPRTKGTATFIASSDKSEMRGVYFIDGDLEVRGEWNLARPRLPTEQPKCSLASLSLAEQLTRYGRLRLYGIHFDVNSDAPRPDSAPTLESIRGMLGEVPDVKVLIEGHTDSTNSKAYNQALSERRAAAVRQWLIDHGVKAGRLKAKGFGLSKPVTSNDTAQGRALNRRVELSVLP